MILIFKILVYNLLCISVLTSEAKTKTLSSKIPSNRHFKTTTILSTTLKVTTTYTRENIPGRDSRADENSRIYFPSSSSPDNSGKTGDTCVTFYGRIGSCQATYNCFQETPLLQTQLLVHCGFVGRDALICCPGESLNTKRKHPLHSNTESDATNTHKSPLVMQPIENGGQNIDNKTPISSAAQMPKLSRPESKPVESVLTQPVEKTQEEMTHVDLIPPMKPKAPNIMPSVSNAIPNEFPELQETCGVRKKGDDSWPWIVSIGHRSENGSVRWHCLGSLITREYILTSALCLQQDPNVIALGAPFLGSMSQEETADHDLRAITQVMAHEKFISPYHYKNVGLVQISAINVSPRLMAICFPFLASVLDIIHFRGFSAKTLGFRFPVDDATGLAFRTEDYRILGNEQCSRIFESRKSETIESLPRGIRSDNVCGLTKNKTAICPAPGAPLALYDEASSAYVIIGIASGDPTCSKFNRQLVTFTRMNAYSTWVRERVATFPAPPPCYY